MFCLRTKAMPSSTEKFVSTFRPCRVPSRTAARAELALSL